MLVIRKLTWTVSKIPGEKNKFLKFITLILEDNKKKEPIFTKLKFLRVKM